MKNRQLKVAGVVVLYHPSIEIIKNIRSYINQVNILFAIDNSVQPNNDVTQQIELFENVIYLRNNTNVGIATALNIGASRALKESYAYLFMMDQDSIASANLIHEFQEYIENHGTEQLGILASSYRFEKYAKKVQALRFQETTTCLTSGSLLNLVAYDKVGPFLDKLFIDYVDFEYCLRLRTKGFKVIQASRALIDHQLGQLVSRRILFKEVAVTNHPPLRIYYRTRNRLFVSWQYCFKFPGWVLRDMVIFVNDIIKFLCFESEKLKKLGMVLRGIIHFLSNRYGRYELRVTNDA